MSLPPTIELIHLGGERKKVPVVSASNTRLTIRWDMAGVYDLIVSKNRFVTKSMMYWKAADVDAMRDVWQLFRFPDKDVSALEESIIRHVRGMPK